MLLLVHYKYDGGAILDSLERKPIENGLLLYTLHSLKSDCCMYILLSCSSLFFVAIALLYCTLNN